MAEAPTKGRSRHFTGGLYKSRLQGGIRIGSLAVHRKRQQAAQAPALHEPRVEGLETTWTCQRQAWKIPGSRFPQQRCSCQLGRNCRCLSVTPSDQARDWRCSSKQRVPARPGRRPGWWHFPPSGHPQFAGPPKGCRADLLAAVSLSHKVVPSSVTSVLPPYGVTRGVCGRPRRTGSEGEGAASSCNLAPPTVVPTGVGLATGDAPAVFK